MPSHFWIISDRKRIGMVRASETQKRLLKSQGDGCGRGGCGERGEHGVGRRYGQPGQGGDCAPLRGAELEPGRDGCGR